MEVAVPDPNMVKPEGWEDMSEFDKNKWYEEQYRQDPNKFQFDFAPLKNNFNKTKLEGTIGRNPNLYLKAKIKIAAIVKGKRKHYLPSKASLNGSQVKKSYKKYYLSSNNGSE
jgi:hypothetical protein